MLIDKVIKELQDDPRKRFENTWNTIESGDDAYEIKISDKEGNQVTVLLNSYREIK